MCEIIDFQSRRSALVRLKAAKRAEEYAHYAARLEWLKLNGAPFADIVRASLNVQKANPVRREIMQGIAEETPENLHS